MSSFEGEKPYFEFTVQGTMVWNSLPDDLRAQQVYMSPLDSAENLAFSY